MSEKSTETSITFAPIGVVHTPYKAGWAPDQPVEQEAESGRFTIEIDAKYAEGLNKLDSFRYVYLITALNQTENPVKMEVSPPWAKGKTAGLFATRTPARPNPIGLHVVRLQKIEGNTLYTWPIDAFDGTPVLDVKPFIRGLDSKDDADYGWLSTFEGARHLLEHMRGLPHEHDHHEHEHHHHDKNKEEHTHTHGDEHHHDDHDHEGQHHHHDHGEEGEHYHHDHDDAGEHYHHNHDDYGEHHHHDHEHDHEHHHHDHKHEDEED